MAIRFLCILLCISFPSLASAEGPASKNPPEKVPSLKFLKEDDVVGLLENPKLRPPSFDSAEDRNDYLEVKEKEKLRTPADCERALMGHSGEIEKSFANLLGKDEAKVLGRCLNYQSPFYSEISHYIYAIKNKYNRPRPFERPKQDVPVKTCPGTPKIGGASFPSGHSALAYGQALILGQLFPDRQQDFLKQAEAIGMDRVVLGVHYPTDVLAGREIAKEIVSALQKSKSFNEFLQNKCAANLTLPAKQSSASQAKPAKQ